ncbi:MAG: tetratricopeptide repeat protein [Paracoccus sp. (in: a-proteobacteria)]|uniref:tetratricopeptide repeat protein n=1 Tax=Paracoccus sp. TaxID=267 RepID=UPI0026DFCBBC|nr:tetratricopeptide repeat protein [Paracoccus sp. (in: a-proteobacteria)]MDO5620043.1 tetratricopeptide repeat protein [Paracoccus sp. (in: a-proteobacteria)]
MNRTLTAFVVLALMAGPALSQQGQPVDDTPPVPRPDHLTPSRSAAEPRAEPVAEPLPAFVPMTKLAGPYLAARQAASDANFTEAARWFQAAMQADPSDVFLRDSALVALVSLGNMDQAVALAGQMANDDQASELSKLIQRAGLAKAGDWQALIDALGPLPRRPQPQELMDGMIRAWAEFGAGRASDANEQFRSLGRISGARGMADYQLALIAALVGDYEGAEALLSESSVGANLLSITARAQILSQLDRDADAVNLLDNLPGADAEPQLETMKTRLQAGETIPFTVVRTAQDGIAQVFLTFASVLADSEAPDPLALIHARLAVWLSPELGDARIVTAQLLQAAGQFDLAEAEYAVLRQQGEVRPIAEMARIDALTNAGRMDDAEGAARALAETHPEMAAAWINFGDILRAQKKYDEAITAYDKSLELLPADRQDRWFPLYARGIAEERAGRFPAAERDMRAALELQPDHPQILNYLGYSWIDRNENLDEALDFIKRAVDARPDDGYILDSLAWAYYRLGRYDEAVAPMERAVTLMAADPLVNDHMGDIYWMVGRKREAVVQWRRALSLNPETEAEAVRIRDKLDRGLDAVLADEAANGGGPDRVHNAVDLFHSQPESAPNGGN